MSHAELNAHVFQSLYFMHQVYEVLDDAADEDEIKLQEYWGAEASDDEGGPAAYVVVDLREKGKKDSLLDVARWFPVAGCPQQLGLYINVLRDDEEDLWDDLVAAFPEAEVDEEETRLGFAWTLPPDASRGQVKEAARAFAKRIVDAIWE